MATGAHLQKKKKEEKPFLHIQLFRSERFLGVEKYLGKNYSSRHYRIIIRGRG